MKTWTFLTNHAFILGLLSKSKRITAREIAEETGITERSVRKIIAELESENYIFKTKEGRRICYDVNRGLPLRKKSLQNVTVGKLLSILDF
jgi:predicted transcriptional regulator